MKNFTIENGQYYKVIDKNTGTLIGFGELIGANTLSTMHDVEFITKEQYESESPSKSPRPF